MSKKHWSAHTAEDQRECLLHIFQLHLKNDITGDLVTGFSSVFEQQIKIEASVPTTSIKPTGNKIMTRDATAASVTPDPSCTLMASLLC